MSWPPGECTAYAASRAPWIGSAQLGNALTWASRWKGLGHQTTMVPTAGSVACFQPGVEGAQGTGHVAYVESVQTNGTFTISEMNCHGCGSPPGGFGKVDKRSGLKPSIGLSFLLPPGGSSPGGVNSLSVTPAGVQTVPAKSSSVLGALGDLTGISGLIGTVINGGEVLFGGVLALVGMWFLARDTGPGRAAGKVVSAGAELAPGGAGKALRAAKAPVRTARASREGKEREATRQRRRQERREDEEARGQERRATLSAQESTERARADKEIGKARQGEARVTYQQHMSREASAMRRREARRRRTASKGVPF